MKDNYFIEMHLFNKIKISKEILLPAFILAFVFCGVIVGETISLSLAVTAFGYTILSKMYLVNGIILFTLPFVFFKFIDKTDRGKLLSNLLLIISIVLIIIFFLLEALQKENSIEGLLIKVLYPISYFSKTILFVTFWTFANDIYSTNESKKNFPIIAAFGLCGGLIGAYSARLLMNILSIQINIAFWALSFLIAFLLTNRARNLYRDRLLPKEEIPEKSSNILLNVGNIFTLKIVRLIAIVYFLVFVSIFCLDYLFWNKCNLKFTNSDSLASFQFTFYQIHAVATMVGLWFILPKLIYKFGYTRIFYALPMVLLTGGAVLSAVMMENSAGIIFITLIIVQFIRNVVFENAFSPIYQMFFTTIEREKRGRAKTLIEGFVKPGAILFSGLILLILKEKTVLVSLIIFLSGVILTFIVYHLRKVHTKNLIPKEMIRNNAGEIIAEVSGSSDQNIYSIVRAYSHSIDADFRIIAVKLLVGIGSRTAFKNLVEIYNKETDLRTKEIIASSLSGFPYYETRTFIDELLKESNSRIRANTINSLINMNCNWKKYLKPVIMRLLFDNSIRVQVQASNYLWHNGNTHEKETVLSLLHNLMGSANQNRRSAGIFLIGLLQPFDWEKTLLENLQSASLQVFTKCVNVILKYGTRDNKIRVFELVDDLSRDHIMILGKEIELLGGEIWDVIMEFFPKAKNRRMVFELVRCSRIISDSVRKSGKQFKLRPEASSVILKWILNEIESVYKDAYVRYYQKELDNQITLEILDDALKENMIRVCEWAVNVMVLLDTKGVLNWRHTDIDIKEKGQRMDLVEIIEGTKHDYIGTLLLPILRAEPFENLVKIGKRKFHFNDIPFNAGIAYFIKSDNRWISLCALYTLYRICTPISENAFAFSVKKEPADKKIPQLSKLTKELMDTKYMDEHTRNEAFECLEKVLFFKTTLLFHNVNAERLMRLAEISQPAFYEKNKIISEQGELSENLYIVKKGSIRVVKTDGNNTAELATLKSGETYGEIGLFTQEPRSATAVADEDCEILVIRRGPLKKLLFEVPEIAYNLLEVLSERLKKNGDKIIEIRSRLKANLPENSIDLKESFIL